jgi:hypothetical protein
MRELFLRVRLGLVARGIDRPQALMASPFLIRKSRYIEVLAVQCLALISVSCGSQPIGILQRRESIGSSIVFEIFLELPLSRIHCMAHGSPAALILDWCKFSCCFPSRS